MTKSKPKFLLDIPDHVIEKACTAYWNTGLHPGQLKWIDLVQQEDHRVPDIRLAIHAALSVAVTQRIEELERINRIRDECLTIAMETLRQYALGRNNAASRSARAEILGRLAELGGAASGTT